MSRKGGPGISTSKFAPYRGKRIKVRFDYGEIASGKVSKTKGGYVLRPHAANSFTLLLSGQDEIVGVRLAGHRYVQPRDEHATKT